MLSITDFSGSDHPTLAHKQAASLFPRQDDTGVVTLTICSTALRLKLREPAHGLRPGL
jgi:hypothetical protein